MEQGFIEEILNKIAEINAEEKAKYCTHYLSPSESIDILEKKHLKKESYATRQSLALFNKIQYNKQLNQYKKTGDPSSFRKVDPLQKFDPTSTEKTVEEIEYYKPWGKLDKQQKINRLMAYVMKLKSHMNLSNNEIIQLRTLLIGAINTRKITRGADVEYSEQIGEVVKIPSLKRNITTKHFYMGDEDDSDINVIKVTETPVGVKPLKKLDLKNFKKSPTLGPVIPDLGLKIQPKESLNLLPKKEVKKKKILLIKKPNGTN